MLAGISKVLTSYQRFSDHPRHEKATSRRLIVSPVGTLFWLPGADSNHDSWIEQRAIQSWEYATGMAGSDLSNYSI
jgi:hypothetical protein